MASLRDIEELRGSGLDSPGRGNGEMFLEILFILAYLANKYEFARSGKKK